MCKCTSFYQEREKESVIDFQIAAEVIVKSVYCTYTPQFQTEPWQKVEVQSKSVTNLSCLTLIQLFIIICSKMKNMRQMLSWVGFGNNKCK